MNAVDAFAAALPPQSFAASKSQRTDQVSAFPRSARIDNTGHEIHLVNSARAGNPVKVEG